jgi:hypothetical protein
MHYSTITSAFVLGLMATVPAIAKPVDFNALAARAEGPINTLYERAVEGTLMARHHKGAGGNGGNGGKAANAQNAGNAGNQGQQAQAQQNAASTGATACAQTGNQKRQ